MGLFQQPVRLFADYEKKNPGVTVELVSIPFPVMKQKLVVALRLGNASQQVLPEKKRAKEAADEAAARINRLFQ